MDQRLIALSGTSEAVHGQTWRSEDGLRIGRLSEVEVALAHETVSRHHAEIKFDDRGWIVSDLGSTNGTFVNGMRVNRSGHPVKAGDVLQFGQVIVQVAEARAGIRASFLFATDRMRLETAITADGAEDAPPGEPDRQLALQHLGRDFYDLRSLESYLDGVLWAAAEALDAQYGAVLTWRHGATRPELRAELACGCEMNRELWIKSRPVHAAMVVCESQLYADPHPTPPAGRAVATGGTPRSLICAVLRSPRRPIGLLCLARSGDRRPFDRDDLALADDMARTVAPTIDSLDRLLADKRDMLLKTLTALARTIELRDGSMSNHCQRVTDYALMLADEIGVPAAERHLLEVGTPLHELGTIGAPDEMLQKWGTLTEYDLDKLRSYPLQGAALLEAVPGLEDFLPIVRNHRERWDGRGFPDGLAGEQIPLVARIVGLADAFDSLTTERGHRTAAAVGEALAVLQKAAGSRFDPSCVAAILRLRPQLERIVRERNECCQTMHANEIRQTRSSILLSAPA